MNATAIVGGRAWACRVSVLCLSVAAIAQQYGPLDAQISPSGTPYVTTAEIAAKSFASLRVVGSLACASGWHTLLGDPYVDPNSGYFNETHKLASMAQSQDTIFADFVTAYFGPSSGYGHLPPFEMRADLGYAFLGRALLSNGVPNPNIVDRVSDPVWNPGPIQQVFGRYGARWDADMRKMWQDHAQDDQGTPSFSMSGVFQAWVWQKVAAEYGGNEDTFFNGSEPWVLIEKMQTLGHVHMDLQTLGLRGPSVTASSYPFYPEDPPTPRLDGFPAQRPRLINGNPARIRFVGTSNGSDGIAFGPISPTLLLPRPVPRNALAVVIMSGWRQAMQIQLRDANQVNYTRNTSWSSYGRMSFLTIDQPVGTTFKIVACRYRNFTGSGYGPWLTLPPGQQIRFVIT
jgi:hypothetical protein